mgnify:CR=1 FL=1
MYVFRLEIWPGYKTAIAQYDGAVMLNVDLSHKVLRTESVLDVMYELYRNRGGPTFQDDCLRRLVGEIVMTRYNQSLCLTACHVCIWIGLKY